MCIRLHFLFCLSIGLFLAAGCDSGTSEPPSDDIVTSLEIETGDTYIFGLGKALQLTVIARTQRGDRVENPDLQWSSSDPAIATVDQEGVVTSVDYGTVTINVSAGSAEETVPVRIVFDVPLEITASTPVAFVGVNVVPMDAERVLANQTVVVREGRIETVGAAGSVAIPAGAEVIEAQGWYLMPGLADMHTHIGDTVLQFFPFGAEDGDESLLLYLANGVTTILNMGDWDFDVLDLRTEVNSGRIAGPSIYAGKMARASSDGTNATNRADSPSEGRALVQSAATRGYDFIKVYNGLSTATFDAIVEEANARGMVVIGHAVRAPGMDYILNNGMVMVAHAEEFFFTSFGGQRDASLIPEVASLAINTGAYMTTTIVTDEVIADMLRANRTDGDAIATYLSRAGAQYIGTQRRSAWRQVYQASYAGQANLDLLIGFLQQFTADFQVAGVPLLLGTDSPGIPGLVPGFSLHDEMQLLAEAGLTPYQILEAGTQNAGAFIAQYVPGADPFGRVAVNQRADLLLLQANPLEDVANLQQRVGVMAQGRWYSDAFLQQQLDAIAEGN